MIQQFDIHMRQCILYSLRNNDISITGSQIPTWVIMSEYYCTCINLNYILKYYPGIYDRLEIPAKVSSQNPKNLPNY